MYEISYVMEYSNILVKFPTRSRPELAIKTLSEYIEKAKDNSRIFYLVSVDEDDEKMTPEALFKLKSLHENVILRKGKSESKIDAINRDINDLFPNWEILLVISDDMHCKMLHWDQEIIEQFSKNLPNGDGCLWYHDGFQKRICTLSLMDRLFYNRMNCVYHPSYKSFFCDNEFTDFAARLNKLIYIDKIIALHNHYAWGGGVKRDELYVRNDKFWAEDENNYKIRKARKFPDFNF